MKAKKTSARKKTGTSASKAKTKPAATKTASKKSMPGMDHSKMKM